MNKQPLIQRVLVENKLNLRYKVVTKVRNNNNNKI